MITINTNNAFPLEELLFTFALESEAANLFNEYNLLICGIGKVNASYHLMKAIQRKRPSVIVNLGSAGSNHFKKGEIVCCTKFIQRDMDVRVLGFRSEEIGRASCREGVWKLEATG